jgi:hypothetical protein
MDALDIHGFGDLEHLTKINKGTLSKYFRQIQRPGVVVIPVLCQALQVSPENLLVGLGVLPGEQKTKHSSR